MSEQIMWAVKDYKGVVNYHRLHDDEESCQRWFAGELWTRAEENGYRCVRVRVTEVQDGP